MEHILDLMEKGTSPYQAVGWGSDFLKRRGFQELDLKKPFVLEEGGRYFVRPYPSALFAFAVGTDFIAANEDGGSKVKLALAHTDSPCFKIKSQPGICHKVLLAGECGAVWRDAEKYLV